MRDSGGNEAIQQRYERERQKRLQFKSTATPSEVSLSVDDIHRESGTNEPCGHQDVETEQSCSIESDCRTLVLIIGAGFSGLLNAIQLLEAGYKHEDILIIDKAGGYGGTWYWNQYPGLMCNAEAYIYMPLLEELGYMPTSKYCGGPEIRRHAVRMADRYGLAGRTVFRSSVHDLTWSEVEGNWHVSLSAGMKTDKSAGLVTIQATFVIMATGLFIRPTRPRIAGIDDFPGDSFHASRWDYKLTGGSPEDPALRNLEDKTVGLIGTGATAIQVLGPLAKHAKKVVVFQRTPASVDFHDNQLTDATTWPEVVASQPGWQSERRWNFYRHVANMDAAESRDIVKDAMTKSPSLSALLGAPGRGIMNETQRREHISQLNRLDHKRQERIRTRVHDTVKDPEVAASLTNWYPSWCKRPLFSDEYLSVFNYGNVQLIDTDGKSIDRLSGSQVLVNDARHHVDCLIFATGYESMHRGDPGSRADIAIRGLYGLSLGEKWSKGPQTLHGIWSNGFPNLFWPGLEQAASDINYTHAAEHYARHITHLIHYATHECGDDHVAIQPSMDAERNWTDEVVALSSSFTVNANCTPTYFNNQGKASAPASEETDRARKRSSAWGDGLETYVARLEQWRQTRRHSEVEIIAGG